MKKSLNRTKREVSDEAGNEIEKERRTLEKGRYYDMSLDY